MLSRNENALFSSCSSLNFFSSSAQASQSTQVAIDANTNAFFHEAENWENLIALTAGSATYNLVRTSLLAFSPSIALQSALIPRMAFQGLIKGFSLASEVTVLRLTHSCLSPHAENPFYHPSWIENFADFAIMKGLRPFVSGQSRLLACGAQSLGLVTFHELLAYSNILPHEEQSFSQKLVQATASALALETGMALFNGLNAGKINIIERNLNLHTQVHVSARQNSPSQTSLSTARFSTHSDVSTNRDNARTRSPRVISILEELAHSRESSETFLGAEFDTRLHEAMLGLTAEETAVVQGEIQAHRLIQQALRMMGQWDNVTLRSPRDMHDFLRRGLLHCILNSEQRLVGVHYTEPLDENLADNHPQQVLRWGGLASDGTREGKRIVMESINRHLNDVKRQGIPLIFKTDNPSVLRLVTTAVGAPVLSYEDCHHRYPRYLALYVTKSSKPESYYYDKWFVVID